MPIQTTLRTELEVVTEESLPHRVRLVNLPDILRQNRLNLSRAEIGGRFAPALRAKFDGAVMTRPRLNAPVTITARLLDEPIRRHTHKLTFDGLRVALEARHGKGSFATTSEYRGTESALLVAFDADVARVYSVLSEEHDPVQTGYRLLKVGATAKSDLQLAALRSTLTPALRSIVPWSRRALPGFMTRVALAVMLLSVTGDLGRARKGGEQVTLWSDGAASVRPLEVPKAVGSTIECPEYSPATERLARAFLKSAVNRVQAGEVPEQVSRDMLELGRLVASDPERGREEVAARSGSLDAYTAPVVEILKIIGLVAGLVYLSYQIKEKRMDLELKKSKAGSTGSGRNP